MLGSRAAAPTNLSASVAGTLSLGQLQAYQLEANHTAPAHAAGDLVKTVQRAIEVRQEQEAVGRGTDTHAAMVQAAAARTGEQRASDERAERRAATEQNYLLAAEAARALESARNNGMSQRNIDMLQAAGMSEAAIAGWSAILAHLSPEQRDQATQALRDIRNTMSEEQRREFDENARLAEQNTPEGREARRRMNQMIDAQKEHHPELQRNPGVDLLQGGLNREEQAHRVAARDEARAGQQEQAELRIAAQAQSLAL